MSRRRKNSVNLAGPIILLAILVYTWLNKNPQALTYIISGAVALVVIVLTLYFYITYKRKKKSIENDDTKKVSEEETEKDKYTTKHLMTEAEKSFFNDLNEIVGSDFIVQPQVNLATVIKKESKNKYQNELYRNIDFGIFRKSDYELLLLIELNDNSHNDPQRKKRDQKVKDICNDANIPLITFWLNMPNTKEYITSRLKTFLSVEVPQEKW